MHMTLRVTAREVVESVLKRKLTAASVHMTGVAVVKGWNMFLDGDFVEITYELSVHDLKAKPEAVK